MCWSAEPADTSSSSSRRSSARLDALEAENRELRTALAGAPAQLRLRRRSACRRTAAADGTVLWQMEQRLSELEAEVGVRRIAPLPDRTAAATAARTTWK